MEEFKWKAPEFEYHEKGSVWEWMVAIVSMAVVVFSLIFWRNFLLGVFAAVAGVSLFFWGKKRPREIEFVVSERGLEIDGREMYPYEELAGYSLSHDDLNGDGLTEIYLKRKASVRGDLHVLVHKDDLQNIRNIIEHFLPEVEHEHSLSDHIARFLKI